MQRMYADGKRDGQQFQTTRPSTSPTSLPNLDHPLHRPRRADADVFGDFDHVAVELQRFEGVFHRDRIHVRTANHAQAQHVFVGIGRSGQMLFDGQFRHLNGKLCVVYCALSVVFRVLFCGDEINIAVK